MSSWSLRSKLLAATVLSATGVLLAMGAWQYVQERRQRFADLESSVDEVASSLSRNLEGPVWNIYKDQAFEMLKNELAISDIVAIVVRDESGGLFTAAANQGGAVAHVTDLSTLPAASGKRPFEVQKDGKVIARGEVLYGHEALDARLAQLLFLTLLQVVLVDAFLVAVLVLVLSRLVFRPLHVLAAEAGGLRDAIGRGELATRADQSKVPAEFRPVLGGMNEVLDAFAEPVSAAARCLDRISRGDVPTPLTVEYRGDFNAIKDALNRSIAAINALIEDAGMLARAAVEGDLSRRADAARHQGDFRRIIEGVNGTLDAVIGPLSAAARCVADISEGRIPRPIDAPARGEFATLQGNLNRCIGAVNLLVEDTAALVQAAVDGQLGARANAERHQGDFRKIVKGVNDTLDAVIEPLTTAARCVAEISEGKIPPPLAAQARGEFATLQECLNRCIRAVNLLVADTSTLARSAVEGRLDTRCDVARHQGDFRRILEGVNQTLDAVVAPIAEATGVLERYADRDLRARVVGSYRGDHARIKDSVNETGDALEGALAQVAAAVAQVSSASGQIAASSQAVASGASEQAATLTETTTSLESVLAITRQATDGAQQANALAQAARVAATAGVAAVQQMQGAMGRIKSSSEGTAQIIRDINDIAFQTNLLALNAAVEAARAGDAGRGFAVVAEEVRSLALRAKEAAARTEELIRQSVKEAVHGEATSTEVSTRLAEIVTGIGKVSAITSEIAVAAREQSSGIDQVSRAVSEMDRVTQQNAASAEESSSAASELSGQAEELAAMVGGFQLEATPPRLPATRSAGTPAPR